jgi:hypothetical protein
MAFALAGATPATHTTQDLLLEAAAAAAEATASSSGDDAVLAAPSREGRPPAGMVVVGVLVGGPPSLEAAVREVVQRLNAMGLGPQAAPTRGVVAGSRHGGASRRGSGAAVQRCWFEVHTLTHQL